MVETGIVLLHLELYRKFTSYFVEETENVTHAGETEGYVPSLEERDIYDVHTVTSPKTNIMAMVYVENAMVQGNVIGAMAKVIYKISTFLVQ